MGSIWHDVSNTDRRDGHWDWKDNDLMIGLMDAFERALILFVDMLLPCRVVVCYVYVLG